MVKRLLEDCDLVTVNEEEVIIDCEEEDECEEERGGGEEVPHVVIVKEVHVLAELVHVPANKTGLNVSDSICCDHLDSGGALLRDWCRWV